jgi:hypothetical protein
VGRAHHGSKREGMDKVDRFHSVEALSMYSVHLLASSLSGVGRVR